MKDTPGYVLGHSTSAARRLEIQDAHFAEASEQLLDALAIRPHDRVVELGCGPGGLSRRILARLGEKGVLVAVDRTPGLLSQAQSSLAGVGKGRFEPTLADIAQLGPWLEGADVVVGRAVLHHIPMAEFTIGRLRTLLRPGTRVGFIEPDFRSVLGRIGYLEASGRPELAPLRVWAVAINQLYQLNQLSGAIGATLARTFEVAGYRKVQDAWAECKSNDMMLENMLMFFDEVSERVQALGILTGEEIELQKRNLRGLMGTSSLPAAWAIFRVTCES